LACEPSPPTLIETNPFPLQHSSNSPTKHAISSTNSSRSTTPSRLYSTSPQSASPSKTPSAAPSQNANHHRHSLALLNMIFAVCLSHRLMDQNTNSAISRRYYDIAIELLKPTLLRDWNISKVQALLLGARHLQCSNSPDECWNVLGLAIRIAHGLELHRASPQDQKRIENEVRKRVWWACFTLDKLLSMIYGRPAVTSSVDFTFPLPEDLDDEFIFADRVLYPTPKRVSGMRFNIRSGKIV
jgi:hypothetical protein